MANILEMDTEKRVKKIIEDFDRSYTNQTPMFEKFERYYKMYRRHLEAEHTRENGSNLYIPYAFSTVETIIPRVVSTMFNTRPYLTALPIAADDVDRAKAMEQLLDYQMDKYIKPVKLFTDLFRGMLIYGTAITKQTWKETKRIVKGYKEELPEGYIEGMPKKRVIDAQEVTIYDAPYIQNIPLEDFFYEPDAAEIEDSAYIIHRYYEGIDAVKEKIKEGLYDGVTEKEIDELMEETADNYSALTRINSVNGTTADHKGKLEILEYWTEDGMVRVANRKLELTVQENPFFHGQKPFIKWVDYSLPQEFYGIGEVDIIHDLQLELNATRNQRMDNVNMAINQMWKKKKSSDIAPDQLISRPNGVIEVDEMDDLEPMRVPDMTMSAQNEEENIKNDIDRTTGVNDYASGGSPSRRETATTASLLAESAGERIKQKIKISEESPFKELGYQLIALNQQFITEPLQIRIYNDQNQPVTKDLTPQDIAGSFDLIPTGSSTQPVVNKESRQNQLTQLWGMLADNPNVNQPELLRAIFDAYEFKNAAELVIEQPQQPPVDPSMDPAMQQVAPEMQQNMENLQGEVQNVQQIQ